MDEGDEAGTVRGDGGAAATLDVLKVPELDDAMVARLKRGALGNARSGSADVEGAHGEVRAGLADGLRGDDANGFAELDHPARSQVAAVAQRANAAAGLAGEHGANAPALDIRGLYGVGQFFGDFLVHINDDVAFKVLDLVERDTADDAVAQRLDFDAGFDDGLDVNAVRGAAIALIDDDVLRPIDEAAGQVAGVRGLGRVIGQAPARPVRGVTR